jgi:predicted transcriptional regulator
MEIIKKRKPAKRIVRSYRLREDLIKKIDSIALSLDESRTYILESLIEYGLEAYEKENKKNAKN